MQQKKNIIITDSDFVVGHRKETYIHILLNKKDVHKLSLIKSAHGLMVENLTGKKGVFIDGKALAKRKRLHPSQSISVKGLKIQCGVKRKKEKASSQQSTSRLKRIKNVYETIFHSLQKMKPFLSQEMLHKEILSKILEVIPSRRAVFLVKKRDKWRQEADLWKKRRKTISVDWMPALARRANVLHKTVFFLHIDLSSRKTKVLSGLYTPLFQGKKSSSIFYIDMESEKNIFEETHVEMLEGISHLGATLIKSTRKLITVHNKSNILVNAYFNTITALAVSIETRDNYTGAHTQRVTRIAELIARELGWPADKMQQIRLGGILHDIGKIGIRDEILKKPGKLTPKEMDEIRKHPEIGANLVKNIRFLEPVIPFILSHQEHFDGKGYPYRLKGRQIPLEGRLMAVADAFDAMTSNRPYRKAMNMEKALEEIVKNKGKQFDPEIVDIFFHLYKDGIIFRILKEFKKQEKIILCPFCSGLILMGKEKNIPFACPDCGKKMKL